MTRATGQVVLGIDFGTSNTAARPGSSRTVTTGAVGGRVELVAVCGLSHR